MVDQCRHQCLFVSVKLFNVHNTGNCELFGLYHFFFFYLDTNLVTRKLESVLEEMSFACFTMPEK